MIDALGDESTDIDLIPPYFLGNIVLIKPIGKTESEIVDGQQRLTTLTILFMDTKNSLRINLRKFSPHCASREFLFDAIALLLRHYLEHLE